MEKKKPLGQLPEHHYEADREWINKMLGYCAFHPTDDSQNERGKVCRAYSKAFIEASSLEPIEHKKSNAGRHEANMRLRIYIEKKFKVFNKD